MNYLLVPKKSQIRKSACSIFAVSEVISKKALCPS